MLLQNYCIKRLKICLHLSKLYDIYYHYNDFQQKHHSVKLLGI